MKITWDKIEELIELSKFPLSAELEALQIKFSSRTEVYYRFLYHLTKYMQPKTSLEIGTWYAVGSTMICNATSNPVIGLDLNNHQQMTILERDFNYHFLQGDSTQLLEQVKPLINKEINLVYQDSSHHYLPTKKEFEVYSPFVRGVWICDDITPAFYNTDVDPLGKGMVQYFEEIPYEKRLFTNLHHGSVQGIVLI